MFERAPDVVESTGFPAWQDYLSRQVLALASAVEDEAPELFSAGVAWSRDAFAARAMPSDGLALALTCLESVLEESLPGEAWSPLGEYFRHARHELESGVAAEPAPPGPASLAGTLAQSYVDALVAGDEVRATSLVREALDEGRLTVQALVDSVLAPAQRELGRRWHVGAVGVGEEHYATQTTRKVLTLALSKAPRARPRERTVVVAAVAGDAHDLGLAFVAAHFELDGWRTLLLGADTPVADLVTFVLRHQPDLVALGATLDEQRVMTAEAIRALRAGRPGLRILVGGAAYAGRPELWRRSGADGHAADAAEAVRKGLGLVGS